MRRIYESDAVVRDDHPHTPAARDDPGPRTVDWAAASHAFVPVGLRDWAVAVDVETDRSTYRVGEPVRLRVAFRNRLPFPIRLRTTSPVLWRWAVDGAVEASTVEEPTPDRPGAFSFARGERKTFTRVWNQSVRRTEREWEPVPPGEYTLSAWVNVDDPDGRGLAAETTVRVEPSP